VASGADLAGGWVGLAEDAGGEQGAGPQRGEALNDARVRL
jgi:hypothetical protein